MFDIMFELIIDCVSNDLDIPFRFPKHTIYIIHKLLFTFEFNDRLINL